MQAHHDAWVKGYEAVSRLWHEGTRSHPGLAGVRDYAVENLKNLSGL
jgi:hypothetical protein